MSSSTAKPAEEKNSKLYNVGMTYACGLTVMFGTAPVIHPFNVIAAAAAKTQLPSWQASSHVYSGLGGNPPNAMANYWNGMTGHLSKEVVRSFGRIGGFIYLEPLCKGTFSAAVAPHVLASVMASFEVVFANPADVWKSYRSTGMPIQARDLFKGSNGNFFRQYMMWYWWSLSTPYLNNFAKDTLELDPSSVRGIAFRSVGQAIVCTAMTYPMELILRTVQVRSDVYNVRDLPTSFKFVGQCLMNPGKIREGAYFQVVSALYKANGLRGLGLGMTAKFCGNLVLLSGANYLPMIVEAAKGKLE